MKWQTYHLPFASKFRLRLLATKIYNILNPEVSLIDMQEYTSAVGDYSKDSLISECRRLMHILAMRGMANTCLDMPEPPPLPYRPLGIRRRCCDCGAEDGTCIGLI